MKTIHISTKVEKCIQSMEQTGKTGRTLARKVSFIIKKLTSGDIRHHMEVICSYTKYGEKRIKNCRKYDLGCGYRLITIKRGENVFISFLGTHDECQRWLGNNSQMKAFHSGKGNTIQIEDGKLSHTTSKDLYTMDMDEDVDSFFQNLTDKDLRTVFRGLVQGARKRLK